MVENISIASKLQLPDKESDIKLRPMNCELLPLTRPDGSALLSQGKISF